MHLEVAYSAFGLYMFLSVCVFPGNWTHNLCAANAMLYHWAHSFVFVIHVNVYLLIKYTTNCITTLDEKKK